MNTQLAFLFPGQGSQSVGMLADLGDRAIVRDTFAEASAVLGYDLWRLCQEGPEADLNQTDRTQPAMLAAGVSVWRLWREQGGAEPCVMAGHSLGEYSALVCADSIDFADAVDLVAERGRLMQAAVPAGEGAMAAIIGLDDDKVVAACAAAAQGEVVSAANFNSPGQVVIAGAAAAVDRAIAACTDAGAKKAVKLAVSVPSHCALMKPAADQLAAKLAGIEVRAPRVPVIHNVDVASHYDADQIRDALARQLYQSVRWVEIVQKLAADGITAAIEAGPGKVLMGLNRRIDRNVVTTPVLDAESLAKALAE
ncbi:MAG: ACP S-malonyltransferase [Chromatiales bacterium]|nr:ACP S-malonyltransferase [Gammaproteobacteria bacterium]MCP5352524.1 ACP S-malonyltransferase [Chromatiales bacterium]